MNPFTLLLRGALLGCLAAAVSGAVPWPVGAPRAVVRVLDRSASLGALGVPSRQASGPRATWLVVADGVASVGAAGEVPALPRGGSRLGQALAEVARSHPGAAVLLESDGRATDDALAGAAALRAAGGRLWTQPPAVPASDAGLLEARARRAARGVEVEALVASSVRGALRLVVEHAGVQVGMRELAVLPGTLERVRLEGLPVQDLPALVTLRLHPLAGTPDDDAGNNVLEVPCAAEARSVVVVGDVDAASLARALPGMEVRAVETAAQAAASGADLVVLAGVPWPALGVPAVRALEQAVAQGGQLLLLGGPRGYARGGWGGTPLERRLAPLHCVAPPAGPVAWVLALDASGSTAGAPARALAQAALAAIASLQPGERLAVLPFRAAAVPEPLEPGWLVAGDAGGRERLWRALEALPAQGPTDLRAGVAAAAGLLAVQPQGAPRALVLLTDGDPDERPDAQALAGLRERLRAADVRFSALVVGMPATVEALRVGVAQRPEHVQLLDGSEVLVAQLLERLARERSVLEQESLGQGWRAAAQGDAPARTLEGLGELEGLHAVDVAPGARRVADAVRSGPAGQGAQARVLAAERTLGSGRVHALAWGPGSSADPAAAVVRLAPWVERLAQEAERGVEVGRAADGGLQVAWPEGRGLGSATLHLGGQQMLLLERAPGLFAAPCPAGLDAQVPEQDMPARVVAQGRSRVLRWPSRPPPEHRGVGVDPAALERLAQAGGGSLLRAGELPPADAQGRGLPTTALWLVLAATLLVVERALAWRRAPSSAREAS